MRFDIPRQRFYFAGYELWISEFAIIFFALMFLMFLVVVSSVFYGRVYCGYLCPQMIFSEASMTLEIAPAPLGRQGFIDWKPEGRATGCTARFSSLVARGFGISGVHLHFLFRRAARPAAQAAVARHPHRRRASPARPSR